MKKNHIYIIGLGMFLLAFCVILGSTLKSKPVAAEPLYSDKAVQIGAWIDEQSAIYDSTEKTRKDLDDQIAKLEEQKAEAIKNRDKAAEVAKGHRYALCMDEGLLRVAGQTATFVKAPEGSCSSFQ